MAIEIYKGVDEISALDRAGPDFFEARDKQINELLTKKQTFYSLPK